MDWWDDLWLNEGFASWMETYATDKIYPDFNMWTEFTGSQQARALQLDSLRSSHPVQVPINHAEEVEQVFDAISYSKGATVVQMVEAILGETNFQQGLQLYMQRYQYKNTTTDDLWGAWQEVSGQPISDIMNIWTNQMGYPLITVKSIVENENQTEFEVEQSWFLSDGSRSDDYELWQIPLKLGNEIQIFSEKMRVLKFDKSVVNKLNTEQKVPLRVLYPLDYYSVLIPQTKLMSASDRFGFLSDTFALVYARYLKVNILVNLLEHFIGENNPTIWGINF